MKKIMGDNETITDLTFKNPVGFDKNYLIEPEYAESRGWGVYYLDDRVPYVDLRELVSDSSLAVGVYIKRTTLGKHETTKFVGTFDSFWDTMIGIFADRCCVFDQPNTFLLTVLYADVSIVATERNVLQKIFGEPETSRDEWIEETRHFKPDLRAEILAKYVRDA